MADRTYACPGCGCTCLHPSPQERGDCRCVCDDCSCLELLCEGE